jgi:hypothetical protein
VASSQGKKKYLHNAATDLLYSDHTTPGAESVPYNTHSFRTITQH